MVNTSQAKVIIHLCSYLIVLYGLTLAIPLMFALYFRERAEIFAFLYTLMICLGTGLIGSFLTRKSPRHNLDRKNGFLLILLLWVIFSLVSGLPLLLNEDMHIRLVDAVFEGVSGITTTGGSVLSNIDALPRSIHYFRAQLNFVGGLGVIILAIAILPLLGVGGLKMYQSEMPGPMKEERVTPRLADGAKNLWFVYLMLGVLCTLAYRVAGLTWFDALCHGIATVSLGGYSTRGDSLGYYNNDAVEVVAGVFSLLSAVSFTLYFFALKKRSVMVILRNPEFRFFIGLAAVVIGITCFELYRVNHFTLRESLVHGFFMASSVMTDNGLAPSDYGSWPQHVIMLLMLSSFFGGCIGSTCGGIKIFRIYVLYQQCKGEIHQILRPNQIKTIKMGTSPIDDRIVKSIWGFFILYIFFTVVLTWILNSMGYDMLTAFATVAACINNMGLGYGATATGFGTLTDGAKWLMCLAMLLGRLEIFPVIVLFSRNFWRY